MGTASSKSTKAMWLKFKEVLDTGVKDFMPLQKWRVGQGIRCMLFNGKVRDKFKRKQRLFRDLNNHCPPAAVAEYKQSQRSEKGN